MSDRGDPAVQIVDVARTLPHPNGGGASVYFTINPDLGVKALAKRVFPAALPPGVEIVIEMDQTGRYEMTGVTKGVVSMMRPDVMTRVAAARIVAPSGDSLFEADPPTPEQRAAWEAAWNTPHWLLGLTPRQIKADPAKWGPQEISGHFVWAGIDRSDGKGFVIQVAPVPDDEDTARHVRHYLFEKDMDLIGAKRANREDFQWEIKMISLRMYAGF